MDDFFKQFRSKFIDEANDLVKKLEGSLMRLETDFADKAAIEEVFRFAHTLKGVSGMYGFDKIEQYTHKLENLFDSIRMGKLQVNTEIIDFTLQSADHISNLLSDFEFERNENREKHCLLLEKLTQFLVTEAINKVTLEKKNPIITDGFPATYYIYFYPDEQIIFRGIKITSVFRDLAELGTFEIFKHQAGVIYEPENANEDAWGIILSTSQPMEEIKDVFLFLEDNCKIYKIADGNLFSDTFDQPALEIPSKKIELHIEDLEKLNQTELTEIIHQIADEPEKNPVFSETTVKTNTLTPDRIISKSITVDLAKLDNLMYLVSELVTNNAQLKLSFNNSDRLQLEAVVENMEKLAKQFRENTFSLRLVHVQENILCFQRLIRDLSHSLNKQIKFEIEGGETELDKSIIDKLTEPLMHLVRNSIDHGIEMPEERIKQQKSEAGTIKFTAAQEGNSIIITISDDGKGINSEKIVRKAIEKGFIPADSKLSEEEIYNLIFLPGLSTAESLTQVSGRGVGMDIVKNKLNELGANISIYSKRNVGTTFTIKLHQNTAIIDTLLFKTDDSFFLVPIIDIELCLIFEKEEFESYRFKNAIPYNDQLISYIDMYSLFNLKQTIARKVKVIVINREGYLYAIAVDNILGEHQAVLKTLDKQLTYRDYISGASVLADGSMAFLLDTNALKKQITFKMAV